MTRENQNDSSGFDRRKFLKTTGAAASVATFGVGNVTAQSAGTVQFTEIGVVHSIDISSGDTFQPRLITNDDRRRYVVNRQRDQLQLLPSAPDEQKKTFKQNEKVVKGAAITPFPASVMSAKPTRFPAVSLAPDFRPMKCLSLANEYNAPTISIESHGDAVSVSGAGQTEVPAKGSNSLSLGTHEVRCEVVTAEGQTTEKAVPLNSELLIRNHGPLDVTSYSKK